MHTSHSGERIPVARMLLPIMLLLGSVASRALDLAKSTVSLPANASPLERTAGRMLVEEIAKRTQIRLAATTDASNNGPLICLGTVQSLAKLFPDLDQGKLDNIRAPEGFRIWIDHPNGQERLVIAGADERGVLYGAGFLLRKMDLSRQKVSIPDAFQILTAPKMKLRGHQLGYRQKTNSYDAWDVPMWEQYIRDLAIFGCNAIELIPPRSDDDPDSPHFPLPPMEMMIEMSRLADMYGMDVWIWYPAMDPDYSNPKTVEAAVREWGDIFRRLPRVDAVFVPGGDPGHTQPKYLFHLLERQTANLRQYHPHATMWVSPQSFGSEWMEEFFDLMKAEPGWLAGVVYGPQVRIPLSDLRARVPQRYPIRDYPDITHSRHCQYPIPNWDLAFALTEGREAINPRPSQMANIFQRITRQESIGFISYSEGCNDDVNKIIWSALSWNPESAVAEILEDYSRYFINPTVAKPFAGLLAGLEENWTGAVETNKLIETHLQLARELENHATPQQKLNWRFQQALYRAYYDALVQRRLAYETRLEAEALAALRDASATGSSAAMLAAEASLQRASGQPVALDLRARLFELGEALFQSIRMQLSTERYLGEEGRGSNLNEVDRPLNNAVWLRHRFAQIRALAGERERLEALAQIANWREPGDGSYYDDLGDPRHQPHLLPGAGWVKDPGFFATPQVGFTDVKAGAEPFPVSWWHSAENLYDQPLHMRYSGLTNSSGYRLRLAYGKYKNNAPVRLVANGNTELHPWLNRPGEILEFKVPLAATATGTLDLTWEPTPGRGGNGRVLDIAEVWLLKRSAVSSP